MKALRQLNRISLAINKGNICAVPFCTQKRFARFETDPESRLRNSQIAAGNWETLKLMQSTPTTHVYNHLLWKLTENLNSDLAKYYYREMIDSNIQPDLETFAIVLSSALAEGSLSRATYYLDEMVKKDFVPTKPFLVALSKVFKLGGEPEFSRQFDSLAAKTELKTDDFTDLLDKLNAKFRK